MVCTAVCAAAIVLYRPALQCEYVFDDRFAVENNEDTTSNRPLHNVFLDDFWGESVARDGPLLRPLWDPLAPGRDAPPPPCALHPPLAHRGKLADDVLEHFPP